MNRNLSKINHIWAHLKPSRNIPFVWFDQSSWTSRLMKICIFEFRGRIRHVVSWNCEPPSTRFPICIFKSRVNLMGQILKWGEKRTWSSSKQLPRLVSEFNWGEEFGWIGADRYRIIHQFQLLVFFFLLLLLSSSKFQLISIWNASFGRPIIPPCQSSTATCNTP